MIPEQRINNDNYNVWYVSSILWKLLIVIQLVVCYYSNQSSCSFLVTGNNIASGSTGTSISGSSKIDDNDNNNIALLGLGGMGIAVVKCLSSTINNTTTSTSSLKRRINVWNRGEEKRLKVQTMNLSNVYVHSTIQDTINDSTIIITMIDDWIGTTQLVLETIVPSILFNVTLLINNKNNKKKDYSIILFSTYTPYDIKLVNNQVSELLSNNNNNNNNNNSTISIVGGAIVGVPQTICTPNAYIITSSNSDSSDSDSDNNSDIVTNTSTSTTNVFKNIGTHIHINTDIGLSSLYNIGLIHTITFGIVGHELIQLILQQYCIKYNLSLNEIKNIYNNQLVSIIVPNYITMLLSLISNNISYVPIQTFSNVMNMHLSYFSNELHINNNTHLSSYVQYLQLTINQTKTTTSTSTNNDDDSSKKQQKIGPAQWIQYATVSSTTTGTSTTDDTNIDDTKTTIEQDKEL